jgi:amino acid transporter
MYDIMQRFQRVLDFHEILLFILLMMSSGIFFLPGIGAMHAGPLSLISWAVIAVISVYVAFCFAELSSLYPTCGGVYEYAKRAYGRFFSFIVGWITLIIGNLTIALAIIGAVSYILPSTRSSLEVLLLSAAFIFIFGYIAFRGIKSSSVMLSLFAVVLLVTLASLFVPGIGNIKTHYFSQFWVLPGSAAIIALVIIAKNFFFFESITPLSEESKQHALPKAIIYGGVISAIVSVLFAAVCLGVVNWRVLEASATPVLLVAEQLFGSTSTMIYMILTFMSLFGVVALLIVTLPRLIYAMAKDRVFVVQFSKLHPNFHTPHVAIFFQVILSVLILAVGITSYSALLKLIIPLLFILYAVTLAAVTVLRYKKPHLKRIFKAPFGSILPIIFAVFLVACLIFWLVNSADALHILRLDLSLVFFGLPIYFLVEIYYNPRAVRKTNNVLAYLVLFTEQLALPKRVRKEIIKLVGKLKNKILLEFGCSVGTLTMHLAEEVGSGGKIYATDISERDLHIARKRIHAQGHKHVTFLHDNMHHSRVHPDIPKIEVVVSVGVLGYIQNIQKVLREMNQRLAIGSKICFLDYDKFFDLIPNIKWLDNDASIKEVFDKAGFRVDVRREQGFAWKYIYIYGKKVRNVK